jgi:cytoskeletal protein CcmA (bactofilin family)
MNMPINQAPSGMSGTSPLPGSMSTDSSSVSSAQGAVIRNSSCLGPGLKIKGEIIGDDNLQIDGNVEGAILLPGRKLTVGRGGQLNCNVDAREIVVYGKIVGNLRATEIVEIKKDGSVCGDVQAARVLIHDGAFFNGYINMDEPDPLATTNLKTPVAPIDGVPN